MAIKKITIDPNNMQRQLLFAAREVYLLIKLSKTKDCTFTVNLLEVMVNQEAEQDPSKLESVFLVLRQEQACLSQVMYGGAELDYEQFVVLSYNTLKALGFIHKAGIVHRDLKPNNILINHMC